jgi:Cu/Ag efflux protein CusF
MAWGTPKMKGKAMRTMLSIFLAGSLALLVGGAAFAKSSEKASGEITHVDAKARTISVKSSDRVIDFEVAADATVMSGPHAEDLGMLEPGQKVDVTYSEEGKSAVASHIEVARASSSFSTSHPYGGTASSNAGSAD